MAIVKMKKLRLLAARSQKAEVLRELIRLGCVEVSQLEEAVQGSEIESLVRQESSKLMSLRTQHASVNHAIALLDRYAPVKSALLSAKPELEVDVLLEEQGIDAALELSADIAAEDERVKRIAAEESRLRGVREALAPWEALDMPLQTESTERCSVLLGSVPAKIAVGQIEAALAAATEEAELFVVSEDKRQRYLLAVCMKEELSAVQECLRPFAFSPAALSGMTGTAKQCSSDAAEALKACGEEKEAAKQRIVECGERREELKLTADRLAAKIALAEAEEKLFGTESTLIMEGWLPADKEQKLEEVLQAYDCAWDTSDPEPEEYPQVPVKLKNNKLTNGLNMVTNMYSLPAYGSLDPNPLMAPFFILFYGLMMADIGYGLIMIIAAIVAMRKIKPKEGTLAFCELLLWGGIATTVCGALTGGFFGDAPYRLVHMFNPDSTWEGLPYLFSPVRDSNTVLYGAMVLGFIQLNTGMIVSFVKKAKAGNIMDGIFEEGPLWVIFIGGIMAALKLLGVTEALVKPGIIVLCIGVVMLLYGAGRHAKGFGKVTAAFGLIYNTLTGWFGDILSYSRIMALMLAGGVVGQVFNTIAAMPAEGMGTNALTVAIFFLIFLIGHALNFALNLLGCFVHDLRLQCLEFFGKFYEDGGRPFAPLRVKGKYVSAKEN